MNDTLGTKLTQQTGRALIEQLQLLVPNPILAAELTHQQLQIAVHGIRLRLSSINGFNPINRATFSATLLVVYQDSGLAPWPRCRLQQK